MSDQYPEHFNEAAAIEVLAILKGLPENERIDTFAVIMRCVFDSNFQITVEALP